MDFHQCVWLVYTAFLMCLISAGSTHAQMDEDAFDWLEPMARRAFGPEYDPEYQWNRQESNRNLDKTLVSLFQKRDMPIVSDNYKRHPRFQRIIPFYSYDTMGTNAGGYGSRPSTVLSGERRRPYAFKPWNLRMRYPGFTFSRRPTYGQDVGPFYTNF